jgi:hypothetical protein
MASRMNCLIHGILISLLFCTKIFWVERLAQQGISRWLLGFWLHARLSGIYHPKAKGRNFPCSCITMHTIPGPCIFQIQQQIIKLAANLQKDPPKPSTNKTVIEMSSFFLDLLSFMWKIFLMEFSNFAMLQTSFSEIDYTPCSTQPWVVVISTSLSNRNCFNISRYCRSLSTCKKSFIIANKTNILLVNCAGYYLNELPVKI